MCGSQKSCALVKAYITWTPKHAFLFACHFLEGETWQGKSPCSRKCHYTLLHRCNRKMLQTTSSTAPCRRPSQARKEAGAARRRVQLRDGGL
eukprot:1139978-Pelagomonas_calceolata.AAC.5